MIMALDLGDTRTGVAFSDATELLAGRAYSITEYHKDRLVLVGLPTNMDGTQGERAQSSQEFARRLGEKCQVPVKLWDERMTSVMANRILSDAGKKRKKQRQRVDAVAASLILQSYLDAGPSQKI